MNSRILNTALLAASMATLLQGCASVVLNPVTESEKDTTGFFDGKWSGVVQKTALRQQGTGNWMLNCNDRKGENYGPLKVSDGKVSASVYGISGTTFVSPTGKFKLNIPLKHIATGSQGSHIKNGKMTLVLSGSLEEQKGLATYHIADLNTGCKSPVTFTKS